MRLAVIDRALGVGLRQGIALAREMGLDGMHIWTVGGDTNPVHLDRSGRLDLRDTLASNGITLSATCIDEGPFNDSRTVDARIARPRLQIDLAVALGTDVVTGHVGEIPEQTGSEEYTLMREAMQEVCRHAGRFGVRYGTETGLEEPSRVRAFIDDVSEIGMAVNYDPANLLVNGFDWLGGVGLLRDSISHCHAKDGFAPEREDASGEAPLGRGDVDFEAFLRALRDIGYDGFIAIEREREGIRRKKFNSE